MNIAERLTPTAAERADLDDKVGRLLASTQAALDAAGIAGTASVQGSIAKDTWLAGNTDVDLFLLLDTSLDESALKQVPDQIGPKLLEDCRKKYAQHPYLVGTFEGMQVDLVPAYAIEDTSQRMSAVDRTPFHTAWVKQNIAGRELEVRMTKQWCKGVGVYGADTATGGFSGYLVEVLTLHLGSFDRFVEWLAAGAQPRRIAVSGDEVDDDVSPLVVVDPIDASRNCGAAVQEGILAAACEAARAYLAAPRDTFFFPAPAKADDVPDLQAALKQQGAVWVGLVLQPQTDRLDIVLPQFHRAERSFTQALERAGFTVIRSRVDDDGKVALQWCIQDELLPESSWHFGPAADAHPNAERFVKKWATHPDTMGEPMKKEGRMAVQIRTPHRDAVGWLAAFLPKAQAGKHVQAALDSAKILSEPVNLDGFWAPAVTDFIYDRRPWQR